MALMIRCLFRAAHTESTVKARDNEIKGLKNFIGVVESAVSKDVRLDTLEYLETAAGITLVKTVHKPRMRARLVQLMRAASASPMPGMSFSRPSATSRSSGGGLTDRFSTAQR